MTEKQIQDVINETPAMANFRGYLVPLVNTKSLQLAIDLFYVTSLALRSALGETGEFTISQFHLLFQGGAEEYGDLLWLTANAHEWVERVDEDKDCFQLVPENFESEIGRGFITSMDLIQNPS